MATSISRPTGHPARRDRDRKRIRSVARPVDAAYVAMAKRWDEICRDPSLNDLPYKIETTASGNIIMSPASNRHGGLQMEIGFALRKHLANGRFIVECSVATAEGVKVADVAWLSPAFVASHGDTTPYPVAPDICVEVLSPINTASEIDAKIGLYLRHGAREVWICASDGAMSFRDHQGALKRSVICPRFPVRV